MQWVAKLHLYQIILSYFCFQNLIIVLMHIRYFFFAKPSVAEVLLKLRIFFVDITHCFATCSTQLRRPYLSQLSERPASNQEPPLNSQPYCSPISSTTFPMLVVPGKNRISKHGNLLKKSGYGCVFTFAISITVLEHTTIAITPFFSNYSKSLKTLLKKNVSPCFSRSMCWLNFCLNTVSNG